MTTTSLEKRLERIEARLETPEDSSSGVFGLLPRRRVGQALVGLLTAGIVAAAGAALDFAIGTLERIEQEQRTLRAAIIDTRILMVDVFDQVSTVPPSEAPETVQKARKQAAKVKATREVFPDADLEVQ